MISLRTWLTVTVAALGAPRDSARAQAVSVMAQAIPIVTRADPTATQAALTEGYLTQPVVMAHAWYGPLQAIGTLNLEGLTLERGELTTGGYGEGYVDRRHPHAYVHELLVGATGTVAGFGASVFAGRGFAPFGSDDPMVRPLEKYPVNHHLAQVLERVVLVGAVRRGPVIAEVGTFNGDEPTGPGSMPKFERFGDSWASRLTVLPLAGVELSVSIAHVTSPELPQGHGLDQRKGSLVARYAHASQKSSRYALVEWEHTGERDRGTLITNLRSVLAEGAYCRAGASVAARIERTDRPEEERLLDPFRTPRPPPDLANLGVSRWTTLTVNVAAPATRAWLVTAQPFAEVARIAVAPGSPPGLFDPELRYGANRMWMFSAGVRLWAAMMHGRMGRYGVAEPDAGMQHPMGTPSHAGESDMMPGMPGMHAGAASAAPSRISLITSCGP